MKMIIADLRILLRRMQLYAGNTDKLTLFVSPNMFKENEDLFNTMVGEIDVVIREE